MIKLILAEDHHLMRSGIKKLLSDAKDIRIVGEAQDGEEAMNLIRKLKPDIAVLDLTMPKMSGIDVLKIIKEKKYRTRIMILTMHDDSELVITAFKSGVNGYLLKDSTKKEFIDAIRTIANGENYFPKKISKILFQRFYQENNPKEYKTKTGEKVHLANREIEIIRLLGKELTNKEIAALLYISPRTVETHRRNIMEKLNIKNLAGLIKYAIQNEIINLN